MSKKSAEFGNLLKLGIHTVAGRERKNAGDIDTELGELLHAGVKSIQGYKSGTVPNHERVKTLAVAIVNRGYIAQHWARDFLQAAHYTGIKELLEELFPQESAGRVPQKRTENLPSATYTYFVPRKQLFEDLDEAMLQGLPIVIVHGFGGTGKTSAVLEFASQCLRKPEAEMRFNGAIWVSDKDEEGTTTLSVVLDTVARCHGLDAENYRRLSSDDKKDRINWLLRANPTLLIIDNFETVQDRELITWLLKYIPPSSKVVITTRELTRELRTRSWAVDVSGMVGEEAREFIHRRVRHLRRQDLLEHVDSLMELVNLTAGNPYAIQAALGYIKYELRPLDEILDELRTAQGGLANDLWGYLFRRCWESLNEDEQRVAMAMTLFPDQANLAALAATAGVRGVDERGILERGSPFKSAFMRLTDFKIVEESQLRGGFEGSSLTRVSQHSLARTFSQAELRRSQNSQFFTEARQRWVDWHVKAAAGIGFCWNRIHRLFELDTPGEIEAFQAVLNWAEANQKDDVVVSICRDLRYYHYVRGNWMSDVSPNIRWAEAAHRLGNVSEEFDALVYHANVLAKQDSLQEAETLLERAETIKSTLPLTPSQELQLRHTQALCYLAKKEYEKARLLWETNLANRAELRSEVLNSNLRWYGTCLLSLGKVEEAKTLFEQMYAHARQHDFLRGAIAAQLKLVNIALELNQTAEAEELLDAIMPEINAVKDRMFEAEAHRLYGRVYDLHGEHDMSQSAFRKAFDLYKLLGNIAKQNYLREVLVEQEHAFPGGVEDDACEVK